MRIFINGRFLEHKITGTQRFAIETLNHMDQLVQKDDEITLLVPRGVDISEFDFKKIKIKETGHFRGNLWIQISLPFYALLHRGRILTLSGSNSILKPDYVYIHDMLIKRYPESYSWKYRFIHSLIYELSIRRCRIIFTNSKFSKHEIRRFYRISGKKIKVTYISGNHVNPYASSDIDLQNLGINKPFLLSVGSKAIHKNHRYIEKLAKKYPDKLFVVTGGGADNFSNINESTRCNILYTGYVDDDVLVDLYQKCEGFIQPSLYEGFGIPILEAICLDCKRVAASNIPVFNELYKNGLYKFDPCDVDSFDMNEFLSCSISDRQRSAYKRRYTWERVAQIIYNSIR